MAITLECIQLQTLLSRLQVHEAVCALSLDHSISMNAVTNLRSAWQRAASGLPSLQVASPVSPLAELHVQQGDLLLRRCLMKRHALSWHQHPPAYVCTDLCNMQEYNAQASETKSDSTTLSQDIQKVSVFSASACSGHASVVLQSYTTAHVSITECESQTNSEWLRHMQPNAGQCQCPSQLHLKSRYTSGKNLSLTKDSMNACNEPALAALTLLDSSLENQPVVMFCSDVLSKRPEASTNCSMASSACRL